MRHQRNICLKKITIQIVQMKIHNSNSTDDLFSQDSEKLLVIHSMIKITLDFFQPEQFTRSFNSSSENMTYLKHGLFSRDPKKLLLIHLMIKMTQYFFNNWNNLQQTSNFPTIKILND